MKKIAVVLFALALLGTGVGTVQAQAPYKMSIGGVVGNYNGASFKMFFNDNVALQADLVYKITAARWWNIQTLELNPNAMYQGNIKTWGVGSLQWFAGGGLSLGYAFNNGGSAGKFGVNAIGGVEFAFNNIPLTTQFDFRPGYGLLFGSNNYTYSYFDWGIAASVRYTF